MTEDEKADDRRLQPRVEQVHLVEVSAYDEEGFRNDISTGRTLNISWGGVRLELHHHLPLRSVVALSLALGDRVVDVTGEVVYLQTLDAERCAMGIEFKDPSEETAAALNDYLASQAT